MAVEEVPREPRWGLMTEDAYKAMTNEIRRQEKEKKKKESDAKETTGAK